MQICKRTLLFLFLLLSGNIFGQEVFPKDSIDPSSFALSFDVAAGGSYYSTQPKVPLHLETKVSKFHPAFSFRANWKTDHRLTVSLETGLLKMYSYTMKGAASEGDLVITAIPLLLEFSMPLLNKFHVRAGAGSYFQSSNLNYLGEVRSKSVNLGWMAGCTYYLFTNETSTGGIEMKWMDAAESEQAVIVVQFSYRYTFKKW